MEKGSKTSDKGNNKNQLNFVDEPEPNEWGKKEPKTFKDLCLQAMQRCIVEGSKEMIQGGTFTELVGDEYITTTIPNQQKVFISNVKSFKILISGVFDETATKNISKLLKEIENIWEIVFEEYIKTETDPYLKQEAERTKQISDLSKYRKMVFESIEESKLEFWRLILQELILLYRRVEPLLSGKTSAKK